MTRAARGVVALSARRERAWVREAQRGSTDALEALFRAHWSRAHRAAYLIVHDEAAAEDIAQEAFLAAVRALDRFDRRRPFGAWLHRIVVNRAIDFARSRALRSEVGAERCAPAASAEDPSDAPYSDALTTALAALPPEQRAVVVLRYLLEYTPGEIAEALDLPRGTVNSRRGQRDGAAYDPRTRRSSRLRPAPIRGRDRHAAVALGRGMLIWGGCCRGSARQLGDGAIYTAR